MNQVLLRTNKEEYLPGDDIYGVVYLNIEDPTAGRGISLIFKGYEHFSYVYSAPGGKQKLEATKDYVDCNVDIYSSSEPFALGNYIFPFKVAVPKVLPATFEAHCNDEVKWKCIVEYWLKTSFIDSDLTATQTITILSKPNQGETNQSTNEEHIIRRFPLLRSINFTIKLVDMSPRSGECLKLRMIITNKSSVKVTSFKIQLLRNLLLICKKDVDSDKLSPNISRLQQRTYIQTDDGPVVVRETGGSTQSLANCDVDRVLDNILIPLTTKQGGRALPPTTTGHHIECKYGLEIMVTLSNNSIVRICHPVPCILIERNTSWQQWKAPDWTATGKVITSDSRFSVSHDQLGCEGFSGLPGFQAL